MLLSPCRASFPPHAVCRTQGRLPIECIHHNTQADACKEPSYPVCFCAASGVFLLLFGLVRQFAGNFSSNLCVSPKMSFFGRLLVKNQKKGLYFYLKSGMLYPTKPHRWIHELLRAVFRSLSRFVPYFAIFFIYLLIIYPACPARGKKSDDSTCTSHRFFFLSVLSQA